MKLAAATIHCPADSRRMEWLAAQEAVLADDPRITWFAQEDRFRQGVWPTYRRAGVRLAESDATHVLILQDDVALCTRFVDGVYRLLELRPEHMICAFNMRAKVVAECEKADTLWYVDPDGVYTHALLCPMEFLRDFLPWVEKHVDPSFIHDDRRWSMWMRWAENSPDQVWTTAVALVQHVGVGRSLLGHNGPKNLASRVAGDALEVDWSHGIERPFRASSTSDVKKNLLPYFRP